MAVRRKNRIDTLYCLRHRRQVCFRVQQRYYSVVPQVTFGYADARRGGETVFIAAGAADVAPPST